MLIVPFILVAILVQAPAWASNQEAAEKIASAIGSRFPDADIDVAYQGGQVWLKGETVSSDQRRRIIEMVHSVPGVNVTGIDEDIQIVAPRSTVGIPARTPAQTLRTAAPALTNPAPIPNRSYVNHAPQGVVAPAPIVATSDRQPQQQHQQQLPPPPPPMMTGADLPPYPYQHYPAAYGMRPGQEPAHPYPYMPTSYIPVGGPVPQHPMPQQSMPQQSMPQYAQQHQPVYYGPPAGAAYHPEAYGPQGPMPGQYNQPNLPDYAWPTYANYPNYAQVSYPRSYSPKAWPYIGPFYPYPQVPMGWRKVTLEHSNGWWWLDFDDGMPSGPFSALFRHPQQYRY